GRGERFPVGGAHAADLRLAPHPEIRGSSDSRTLGRYPDRLSAEPAAIALRSVTKPFAARRIEELVEDDPVMSGREAGGHRVVVREGLRRELRRCWGAHAVAREAREIRERVSVEKAVAERVERHHDHSRRARGRRAGYGGSLPGAGRTEQCGRNDRDLRQPSSCPESSTQTTNRPGS